MATHYAERRCVFMRIRFVRGNQIQIELCSPVTLTAPDLLDEIILARMSFKHNVVYWSSN